MKRYESYRPSGISWIGEIPSHWEITRIKWLLSERIEKSSTGKETPLSMSQKRGIVPTAEMESVPNIASSYIGAKIVKKGDLVFNKLKAHLGVFAESDYNGLVSPDYAVYYSSGICNLSLLKDIFHTPKYISEFKKHMSGVAIGLTRLYTPDLFDIHIALPPLAEQEKIVEYLSIKTSQIDAQQRERERELRLLDELKQAEIVNVVTRGLNPDVPMKNAQTIQFGQIPAHWKERKIQYCFDERSQKGFPDEPMLCATQSQGVIPQSLYSNRVVVVNKDFDKQKLVKVGDFVISLRSFEGGIEYAYYRGIISAAYTILTPKEIENSEYYKHLFKSFSFIQLLQTCVTGIREGQNINYPFLSKHSIPIPPIEEQRAIVAYIERKNKAIDEMIASLKAEIEFLTEYKQRLIADVVTGQLKVE